MVDKIGPDMASGSVSGAAKDSPRRVFLDRVFVEGRKHCIDVIIDQNGDVLPLPKKTEKAFINEILDPKPETGVRPNSPAGREIVDQIHQKQKEFSARVNEYRNMPIEQFMKLVDERVTLVDARESECVCPTGPKPEEVKAWIENPKTGYRTLASVVLAYQDFYSNSSTKGETLSLTRLNMREQGVPSDLLKDVPDTKRDPDHVLYTITHYPPGKE